MHAFSAMESGGLPGLLLICGASDGRVWAVGNVGNLPLVLVAALCEDSSSPIANAVAPGKCTELGIAYVVFAMWVAGLFQFTFGYFLLKPSAEVRPACGLACMLPPYESIIICTLFIFDMHDLIGGHVPCVKFQMVNVLGKMVVQRFAQCCAGQSSQAANSAAGPAWLLKREQRTP